MFSLPSDRRDRWAILALGLFAFIYVVVLISHAALGPTDDFVFLRTLQQGKPLLYYSSSFPYYDMYKIGRFSPLTAMEYNLVGLFSRSPDPAWYYAIHAIQLLAFLVLMVALLRSLKLSYRWSCLIAALLTLLPGFTFTWFRLQMTEHDVLIAFLVFLLAYLAEREKHRLSTFLVTLTAANIALYYKETAFIAIGAFALAHQLLSRPPERLNLRRLDLLLIVSVLFYLFLYAVLILPGGGILSYGKDAQSFLAVTFKNFLNYTFVSDSFLMLVIVPLALWRFIVLLRRRAEPEPIADALLFASVAYIAGFALLRFSSVYYFLPLYALALPAAFWLLRQKQYRKRGWKILIAVTIFCTAVNTIPLGLHQLTYYKYQSVNFNRALDTIIADARTRPAHARANIFLAGLNRGSGNWTYFIVSEFLQAKGLRADQFDLRAEIEDERKPKEQPLPLAVPKITLPYTVFQGDGPSQPTSGDYLIVGPLSNDPGRNSISHTYLQSLETDYRLLYASRSRFELPQATLKEVGRLLVSSGATPDQHFLGISRKPPNWDSPDYYVFIKR